MQLAYRGSIYETQLPKVATKAGKVIGKYRGSALHERIVIQK